MADQMPVDHPSFSRFYSFMSRPESESLRAWRRENLADLSGRVLESGAGTGTNFAGRTWSIPPTNRGVQR